MLEYKKMFDQYVGQSIRKLSVFSFVSLYCWKDFFQFDFKIVHDHLCIFARDDQTCFLYLPPLGNAFDPRVIKECFDQLDQLNVNRDISRIENVSEDQLRYFPSDQFKACKKGYEYLYFKDDLTALKGNAYKSKRSSYNQFTNHDSYRLCDYTQDMFEDCQNLYDSWSRERLKQNQDDIYGHMIKENRVVHRLVMEQHDELGFVGKVVIVDGELKGYAFGYPINDQIFCILLEVTELSIKGLAVFIFREFCRSEMLKQYQFINVMDDSGLKNLEKTKLSFRPAVMEPVYTVQRRV